MRLKLFILIFLPVLFMYCGITKKDVKVTPEPVKTDEEWLNTAEGLVQTGVASWYGSDFQGKRTANGEIYDMNKLTAAHKYLPFHTLVEVENLDNNKKVLVRINDRGPFVEGRVIDLSRKAAQRIGIEDTGTTRVRLRIVKATDIANIPPKKPTEADTNQDQETGLEKEEISVTEVKETGIPQSTVPPPPKPPPTVQSDTLSGYYLQAGAFSSMKNAKRQLRQIKRILPGVAFNVQYTDGLYKIISDQLGSRETAETFKEHLEKNGIEAIVRELNGPY
jgi:rare lipoprotein A